MSELVHAYAWRDKLICVTQHILCVTQHIHMWDMPHSYARHMIFHTWLSHVCYTANVFVWHDLFICVTWLIYECGVTYSHVWNGSWNCLIELAHMCVIHMCDLTHSCVRRDSCIRRTWHMKMCKDVENVDLLHIEIHSLRERFHFNAIKQGRGCVCECVCVIARVSK